MGLKEEERVELEAMRDAIANRLSELEDKVSFGVISDERRHLLLQQEFGDDYWNTLRSINQILHSTEKLHRPIPNIPQAAVFLAFLAVAAIIAGLIYPGMTGAVVTDGEFVIGKTLEHMDTLRLIIDIPVTIESVDIDYSGEGMYSVYLSSKEKDLLLAEGDHENDVCGGCGETIKPPYLLEVKTTGGEVRLNSFTIKT